MLQLDTHQLIEELGVFSRQRREVEDHAEQLKLQNGRERAICENGKGAKENI